MPLWVENVDPKYRAVMKDLQYAEVPHRRPEDTAKRPGTGKGAMVPTGSPTAGRIRQAQDQSTHKDRTHGRQRDPILRQGFVVVERITQPRDERQLKEHQGVSKAWKPPGRGGRKGTP